MKTILVKGPALSRSGYGEQTRFALRALRAHPDRFNILLMNISWGHTGWYNQDDEEFSLPKHSLERQTRHVGEGKAFQSIEDVPESFLYPDYQCGICGEECETISMNASQVRPAQIKINESK